MAFGHTNGAQRAELPIRHPLPGGGGDGPLLPRLPLPLPGTEGVEAGGRSKHESSCKWGGMEWNVKQSGQRETGGWNWNWNWILSRGRVRTPFPRPPFAIPKEKLFSTARSVEWRPCLVLAACGRSRCGCAALLLSIILCLPSRHK